MTARIGHVVWKVASRCNLNCGYCYLYNHEDTSALRQPKRMPTDLRRLSLEKLRAYCDGRDSSIGLTLHGGEPMLLGVAGLEELIVETKGVLGPRLASLSMQTNATLVTPAIASMLVRHDVNVGISLDGPPEIHDPARPTHAGLGSHAKTIEGIKHLSRAGLTTNVLCVVNPQTDGLKAYEHFLEIGLTGFDFLLPDVSHDNRLAFYGDGAHPVYDFLAPILDRWLSDNNTAVRIPIFEDLLQAVMSGRPVLSECFGEPRMGYIVLNTDGTIEPLDALKVCSSGITSNTHNIATDSLEDLDQGGDLLAKCLSGSFSMPQKCQECRWSDLCGGGYLPHRFSNADGFDNPSVWCRDIQMLLDHMSDLCRDYPVRRAENVA